jgi:hypothetical protein
MFLGPLDGTVEFFSHRGAMQPQFVFGYDPRRLYQPDAILDLLDSDGTAGMLFAKRDLPAGTDRFDLDSHFVPLICMIA